VIINTAIFVYLTSSISALETLVNVSFETSGPIDELRGITFQNTVIFIFTEFCSKLHLASLVH
jgi:hypothetical protein